MRLAIDPMPRTDVLLVVPRARSLYRVPPIGLGILASCLRASGLSPAIADCLRDGLAPAALADLVERTKPQVVGLQVFSADVPHARACLAAICAKRNRNRALVVGGPHVTGRGEAALADIPEADLAFIGEAEEGIVPFIRAIAQGGSPAAFEKIPGLVWREEGAVRSANGPARIQDLDALPLPAWDLMEPRTYPARPHGGFFRGWPIGPIITTRGCPYGCRFCASPVTSGKRWRRRSLVRIFEEIELLTGRHGVREIHILDDAFTADRARTIEFFERSIQSHPGLFYAFPNGVRLDNLDREALALMKRGGVYSFTIGIESGSQRVLDAMGKGLDLTTVREKVGLMNEMGIRPHAFFILGYPGETRKEMEQTIRLTRTLGLGRVHFSNFLPLPGTPVTRELERAGAIGKIDWSRLTYSHASFPPVGMTCRELKRLHRRAVAGYYLRPRALASLLRELRSLSQVVSVLQRVYDYVVRA